MKKILTETSKARVLFVEFPMWSRHIIKTDLQPNILVYFNNYGGERYSLNETLPEGNWQLLGRIEDITEEQAELVVDRWSSHPDFFADYPLTWQNREHYNETAVEAFQSFCASLDVPENSVALIDPKK